MNQDFAIGEYLGSEIGAATNGGYALPVPQTPGFLDGVIDGYNEQLDTMGQSISRAAGGVSKGFFSAVPWYVWLFLVVGLLVYLGAFKNILSRRSA